MGAGATRGAAAVGHAREGEGDGRAASDRARRRRAGRWSHRRRTSLRMVGTAEADARGACARLHVDGARPEAAAARAGLLEQVFWPGEATRADPRDRVAP